MKTPYAILIGLALIAAAIFYREPSIKSAHAGIGGADGFECWPFSRQPMFAQCVILDGDQVYFVVNRNMTIIDEDLPMKGTLIAKAKLR